MAGYIEIKPANIRVQFDHAVILDLEGSKRLNPGETIEPRPGSGGKITYS
jgi:hypothetical protein